MNSLREEVIRLRMLVADLDGAVSFGCRDVRAETVIAIARKVAVAANRIGAVAEEEQSAAARGITE